MTKCKSAEDVQNKLNKTLRKMIWIRQLFLQKRCKISILTWFNIERKLFQNFKNRSATTTHLILSGITNLCVFSNTKFLVLFEFNNMRWVIFRRILLLYNLIRSPSEYHVSKTRRLGIKTYSIFMFDVHSKWRHTGLRNKCVTEIQKNWSAPHFLTGRTVTIRLNQVVRQVPALIKS